MINWEKVLELCGEIGPDDFGEVVELFLEEVEEVIEKMPDNIPREDMESSLHFLKGSALNLGFDDLSRLCANDEAAAATGRFDDVDLGAIVETYTASKAEFLANLDARIAA